MEAPDAAKLRFHRGNRRQQCHSLVDQQLCAAAGNKDAVVELNPQPSKICPAENMLQGITGNAPLHCGSNFGRPGRGSHEELGFLLSENTSGGAKAVNNPGKGITAQFGA